MRREDPRHRSRSHPQQPLHHYRHLKDEFEARRQQQRNAGIIADPTQGRITRLKTDNAALRERLAHRDKTIAELIAFRTTAISQLAAQHDEILRLRQQITDHGIRVMHPRPDNGKSVSTRPSSRKPTPATVDEGPR